MKLMSWNMHGATANWAALDGDVDIALLQETPRPPSDVRYEACPAVRDAWSTTGWTGNLWQRTTAVAAPSGRYQLRPLTVHTVDAPVEGGVAVSRLGALAVCEVLDGDQVVLTVASAYAFWMRPRTDERLIFSDASAHAILSDLSPLITDANTHRVVLAGDLNLLFRYSEGENRDRVYWQARYDSVFDRADAMGLTYVGPRSPNGRQADPWPAELPTDSLCVPTYHTRSVGPAGATRQLDHVFASRSIADSVKVRAMNQIEEWGESDHCRIGILLQ